MPISKAISITDFDTKKFQNFFSNFNGEEKAIITHYLYHLNDKDFSKFYQKEFQEILDTYFLFKNEKISKDNIQKQFLNELKNINFLPNNNAFTFIDLFAGIGGFRIALQNLGGKCVFSSEWNAKAKETYFNNFGEYPFGDITKEKVKNYIPDNFDVLCAGFPCQPFSKGGFQNGFEDTRGTLFFDICEIIDKHKPKFLFLENVANLVTHDEKNTYKTILKHLDKLGYYFPNHPLILSPDQFGMPILRPRIYIPCVRKDVAENDVDFIKNFEKYLEKYFTDEVKSIDTIIDGNNSESDISEYELKVLNMWNDFYKNIDLDVIGFPIWVDFFKYNGSYTGFAGWKAKFVKKNVEVYQRNQSFIDKWLNKNDDLNWVKPTHRKFEWQAGKFHDDVFQGLIQFRPSGVRVKRATKFSTLVAMNHRQIIGKLKRKISLEESKALQFFPKEYKLNPVDSVALKQLGNSVNVNVVQLIFELISTRYRTNIL